MEVCVFNTVGEYNKELRLRHEASVIRKRVLEDQSKKRMTVKAIYARRAKAARGQRCHYCEQALNGQTATKDHVIPKSRGGGRGENLVWACKKCNGLKGNTVGIWYKGCMTKPEFRKLFKGVVNG